MSNDQSFPPVQTVEKAQKLFCIYGLGVRPGQLFPSPYSHLVVKNAKGKMLFDPREYAAIYVGVDAFSRQSEGWSEKLGEALVSCYRLRKILQDEGSIISNPHANYNPRTGISAGKTLDAAEKGRILKFCETIIKIIEPAEFSKPAFVYGALIRPSVYSKRWKTAFDAGGDVERSLKKSGERDYDAINKASGQKYCQTFFAELQEDMKGGLHGALDMLALCFDGFLNPPKIKTAGILPENIAKKADIALRYLETALSKSGGALVSDPVKREIIEQSVTQAKLYMAQHHKKTVSVEDPKQGGHHARRGR